ncbi:TPA: membrane-associated sensor domain-containing protein [Photobacterium damselae]
MTTLPLRNSLERAVYKNLQQGIRWCSAISLIVMAMMLFTLKTMSIDKELFDWEPSSYQYSFQLVIYVAGLFSFSTTPRRYWRYECDTYAILFGLSWSIAIYHIAIIYQSFLSASIFANLLMMAALLALYSRTQTLYLAVTPIFLISSWSYFVRDDYAILIALQETTATILIIETGRRILSRWFTRSVERDVENKRLLSELTQLASRDQLTNLYNRRFFEYELDKQTVQAKRYNIPFSVILIDIDYFKRYNDALGHLQGDECLKIVAKVLNASLLRGADSVSRYGGEEFVVILPNTDIDGAIQVAERIQSNMAKMVIPHPDSEISNVVTLSQGIAAWKNHRGPTQLIKEADNHLYQAKELGRAQYKAA